jgi:site-specific DNA-cytosine methylase
MEVDHIDRNPLNNARANLRLATRQENSRNRVMSKGNTTGFVGVRFSKGKYEANIVVDGQAKHLGRYDDAKTAALVRDAAARRFFGEFAVLAFPDDYIVLGNAKERTKLLGNAVTSPVMEMLMERCMETFVGDKEAYA